jgi:hypothetical protein
MPRPLRSLRYRRCPSCETISRASAFWRAAVPFNTARGQLQRRECPNCGYVAPLVDFAIAERPLDQARPPDA